MLRLIFFCFIINSTFAQNYSDSLSNNGAFIATSKSSLSNFRISRIRNYRVAPIELKKAMKFLNTDFCFYLNPELILAKMHLKDSSLKDSLIGLLKLNDTLDISSFLDRPLFNLAVQETLALCTKERKVNIYNRDGNLAIKKLKIANACEILNRPGCYWCGKIFYEAKSKLVVAFYKELLANPRGVED